MQGCKDARMQGCKDARMRGYEHIRSDDGCRGPSGTETEADAGEAGVGTEAEAGTEVQVPNRLDVGECSTKTGKGSEEGMCNKKQHTS